MCGAGTAASIVSLAFEHERSCQPAISKGGEMWLWFCPSGCCQCVGRSGGRAVGPTDVGGSECGDTTVAKSPMAGRDRPGSCSVSGGQSPPSFAKPGAAGLSGATWGGRTPSPHGPAPPTHYYVVNTKSCSTIFCF